MKSLIHLRQKETCNNMIQPFVTLKILYKRRLEEVITALSGYESEWDDPNWMTEMCLSCSIMKMKTMIGKYSFIYA